MGDKPRWVKDKQAPSFIFAFHYYLPVVYWVVAVLFYCTSSFVQCCSNPFFTSHCWNLARSTCFSSDYHCWSNTNSTQVVGSYSVVNIIKGTRNMVFVMLVKSWEQLLCLGQQGTSVNPLTTRMGWESAFLWYIVKKEWSWSIHSNLSQSN